MRLLRGFGMMAAGVLMIAAGAVYAQSSQQNSQTNGNTGSSSTTNNNTNVPYVPPTPPSGGYGDASKASNGYGGTGSTQSGSSGSYGSGQNGTPSVIGHITSNNPLAEDTPENQQQMEMQQARARNAERQKQLVADTQKLVALATELQDEVNKSTKDMLSLDVVRKADEIDKLAKTVRDKMKNAN